MTQHQPYSTLRPWIFLAAAICIFISIGLWKTKIAPDLKKMPSQFTYSADILSIDNFYDEQTKKFQGEHISKTAFSYRVINSNNKYYTVENMFAVRTLNDVPIISITRIYFINPYTWQHTSVLDQQIRTGFLFGPQYANTQDYYYWHINYNIQALLKFVDKEYIDGLEVYHYQTYYTADQSKDLSYLPDVPEKRGIITKINLNLWIEPISGWIVKFKDNSVAYYYDKKTGEIISPWNKFSNRYTATSTHEQVAKARYLKYRNLIIDYGIPFLLFILAIIMVCYGFKVNIINNNLFNKYLYKWNQYKESFYRYSLSVIVILLSVLTIYYFFFYTKKPVLYSIGISQWSNNCDLIETVKGFKAGLESSGYKEGINVKYILNIPNSNIENQIRILQTFLDQNVDMLFVLTTQGTLVAKGMTAKTPIVFSNVIYPEESNIISTAKSSQQNLVGIRNYVSPARQYNAFEKIFPNTKVLGFIHKKGDPDSEFQYHEYRKLLAKRDIQVIDIPAIDLDDLNHQLSRKDLHYNAIFLACDTLIQEGAGKIVADFSNKNNIPNFSCDKSSILNGALMGVVVDPYTSGLMAGKQAALILDGANPAWLHTETPEHATLIINDKTAKLLKIHIPEEILKNPVYIINGNQQ